eukprot:TRINITY_DN4489_c0_g1_i1.p1 TRINITY_DN4489_c0_g1~~TRINITY_DN4489_c0_g1_i1.p1  ORF type:complete len:442 (-),score=49.98 TRINITY_DN4489_c0_g1_i1:5-1288(-)
MSNCRIVTISGFLIRAVLLVLLASHTFAAESIVDDIVPGLGSGLNSLGSRSTSTAYCPALVGNFGYYAAYGSLAYDSVPASAAGRAVEFQTACSSSESGYLFRVTGIAIKLTSSNKCSRHVLTLNAEADGRPGSQLASTSNMFLNGKTASFYFAEAVRLSCDTTYWITVEIVGNSWARVNKNGCNDGSGNGECINEVAYQSSGTSSWTTARNYPYAYQVSACAIVPPALSRTPSPSRSATPSCSAYPSRSASPSSTLSPSVSPSPSRSASPSASASRSSSKSVTPSTSVSASPTASPSATPSPSRSASISASPSATLSPPATRSRSVSASPSRTAIPSSSPSPSRSTSTSPTPQALIPPMCYQPSPLRLKKAPHASPQTTPSPSVPRSLAPSPVYGTSSPALLHTSTPQSPAPAPSRSKASNAYNNH